MRCGRPRNLHSSSVRNVPTPKAVIVTPESLLIHFSVRGPTFVLTAPTLVLSTTHHRTDPAKTPETRTAAAT